MVLESFEFCSFRGVIDIMSLFCLTKSEEELVTGTRNCTYYVH